MRLTKLLDILTPETHIIIDIDEKKMYEGTAENLPYGIMQACNYRNIYAVENTSIGAKAIMIIYLGSIILS